MKKTESLILASSQNLINCLSSLVFYLMKHNLPDDNTITIANTMIQIKCKN